MRIRKEVRPNMRSYNRTLSRLERAKVYDVPGTIKARGEMWQLLYARRKRS